MAKWFDDGNIGEMGFYSHDDLPAFLPLVIILISQHTIYAPAAVNNAVRFPSGHVVKALGPLGDLKAEGEAVLVQV